MKFFLSTIADLDAIVDGEKVSINNKNVVAPFASEQGLGIEIADFCIGEYLDEKYDEACETVKKKISALGQDSNPSDIIFHAPYNELYPTAIDKKVRDVAIYRFEQSLRLAREFGALKIVIHSGFVPTTYYKEYFINQSIKFWREFLEGHPGDYIICLENVMEDEPEMLRKIAETVDDDRLRICVDIGHAFVNGADPVEWVRASAPYLSHLHIHNNYGRKPGGEGATSDGTTSNSSAPNGAASDGSASDKHLPLGEGLIDIDAVLKEAARINPSITATVECTDIESCTSWLKEKGWI